MYVFAVYLIANLHAMVCCFFSN